MNIRLRSPDLIHAAREGTGSPGLGQITWWIVLTKQIQGLFGKYTERKSRNSWFVSGGGVGAHGQLAPGQIFSVLKLKTTNAQRLPLLSKLLLSLLYASVQNCYSFLRSL